MKQFNNDTYNLQRKWFIMRLFSSILKWHIEADFKQIEQFN